MKVRSFLVQNTAFRLLTLAVPTTLAICAAPGAWAQGSDNCATAQPIGGLGPHAFDTTLATTGTQGQIVACSVTQGIDNDVWFRWTAPQSGIVVLSTCQQTTVDTKIAVYSGTGCPTNGALACSDDDCNLQSQAEFSTSAGVTYVLQIGSSPGNPGGTGTFTFTYMLPLTNDSCTTPAVISGPGPIPFDNSLASTGAEGQNNPGCTNVKHDLWYRWTAPVTGVAHLSLCGLTAVDTAIAVYSGAACPTAFAIACDDDACGLQSATNWPVTVGTVFMLQIGGAGGFSGGIGQFTIDVTPTPANDDCSQPISVSGSSATFDTTSATMGSQGQASPCGGIDHDLWYVWTSAANGNATIDTCGQTALDTLLAVYVGSACPAGTSLACDNDGCGVQSTVTFNTTAGVHYLIQVGTPAGTPGGPGSFVITQNGPSITPYCFGDGTGLACPCGNNGSIGRGCANSFVAAGALLTATGTASVSADSLLLQCSGMTPTGTSVYFQGTQQANGGLGVLLGDGLRCVGGSLIRFGAKQNVGGASSYGAPNGDIAVSVRGLLPPAGGIRDYQCWYRNPQTFCTSATYNLSNGLEVLWVP